MTHSPLFSWRCGSLIVHVYTLSEVPYKLKSYSCSYRLLLDRILTINTPAPNNILSYCRFYVTVHIISVYNSEYQGLHLTVTVKFMPKICVV